MPCGDGENRWEGPNRVAEGFKKSPCIWFYRGGDPRVAPFASRAGRRNAPRPSEEIPQHSWRRS